VKTRIVVRKDSYHDSVLLMRLSRELKARTGAEEAVVVMGTPANRDLLAGIGFSKDELAGAGPNDLVIALRGLEGRTEELEATLDALLSADAGPRETESRPPTLAAAVSAHPESNLVLISVPGEYAAREARRALGLGRHVMLFSDNVAVEDEIALKEEAAGKGLLMMGPDCGTAIVNGKPLGFANVVRRGSIGIVGASGTGIQEVSSAIHRLKGGVSQAVGTGGRDLSDAVGGRMTLLGIEALAADPETKVLVVISKPPSVAVAKRVVAALERAGKPAVVHFVGAEPEAAKGEIVFADTLAGAAEAACRAAGVENVHPGVQGSVRPKAASLAARLAPGSLLRGLFCGGTTAVEALVILERAGITVRSNLHRGPAWVEGESTDDHVLLDLGDDVFTRGRPHPMIEPELRNERLLHEVADPRVGLLLFDVILGYGSHPDPAGVLVDGLERARAASGRELVAVASVTGTLDDPQDYLRQTGTLVDAGVAVNLDNRTAAWMTAAILKGGGDDE
jgi:FdrA protein